MKGIKITDKTFTHYVKETYLDFKVSNEAIGWKEEPSWFEQFLDMKEFKNIWKLSYINETQAVMIWYISKPKPKHMLDMMKTIHDKNIANEHEYMYQWLIERFDFQDFDFEKLAKATIK